MQELYDNTTRLTLFTAATRSASANGTGADVAGFIGELAVTLISGPGAGGGTNTVKLQDSDDDATYADLTGKAFTAVGAAGVISRFKLDTRACKKYVRAVSTISGTWSGAFGVIADGIKQVS
jgi:hypothetical protein